MALMTKTWTVAEYHRLVDQGILDDQPVELLAGEIVVMSPEGEPHASISTDAGEYLVQRAQCAPGKADHTHRSRLRTGAGPGSRGTAGASVSRSSPVSGERVWLIEYANTSLSKDLDQKKRVYADAGIPEYWVVNLRDMTVLVFRDPEAGTYRSEQTLESGVIHPLALPDIAVSIDRLL